MDEFTTDSSCAEMPTMHIAASGMTITALSESGPTTDSTESDSEPSEFTATASSSHIRCLLEEMTEEHANQLLSDFSALWKERIVEELGPGIFHVKLKRNSKDGSIGPSQEEVEPSD